MTEPSRLIGYCRVSKTSQNTDIQIDALTAAGCRKIFLDKSSGKRWSRKGLKDALAHIRPGDQLVVWKVDRIGRTALPILTILDKLQQRGASLLSLSESCDSGTQNGRIQCLFLAIMAEIEGLNITIRTQAGVDAAALRGRHRGGQAKLTMTQIDQAARMMERGMSAKSVAMEYKIGRATLFRHLKASRDMMLAR